MVISVTDSNFQSDNSECLLSRGKKDKTADDKMIAPRKCSNCLIGITVWYHKDKEDLFDCDPN